MKFINLGTYVFMVGMNILASALPLNAQTTAEVSDRYPTLFTPAGYVFSIWGLIYILLGAFVVRGFIRDDERVEGLGYLFAISSIINGTWIIAWHWEALAVSLVLMLVLLATLILIVLRLQRSAPRSLRQRWMVDIPFSVYLGWISVATIANVAVVLSSANWDGFGIGPVAWTIVVIGAAGLLGALSVLRKGDVAYTLVIIWALSGVGAANADRLILAGTAWGMGVLLALLIGYRWAQVNAARTV